MSAAVLGEIPGFQIELSENLLLTVVDEFATAVPQIDTLTINDGTTTTVLENVTGNVYDIFVEAATNFTITAVYGNLSGTVTVNHLGGNQVIPQTITVVSPPCVSKQTVNIYSFFQWFKISGFSLTDINKTNLTLSCAGEFNDDLPNVFNIDDSTEWQPVLVQGEQISIQINHRFTTLPAGPLKLALVHDFTVVTQDIPVNIYTDSNGSMVYFSYTFAESMLIAGCDYRFILYDSATNKLMYLSNFFEIGYLGHLETLNNNTLKLKYRHHDNLDGFEYVGLPDFYNELRVRANLTDFGFDFDRQNYKEVTTGINTREKSQKSKFVQIEPYLFNHYAHEALASLTDHEEVYLNDMKVNSKQGSAVRFNREMKTHFGETVWYIEKFSTINY